MPLSSTTAQPQRVFPQKLGLVLGLALFTGLLTTPTPASLTEHVATMLGQPTEAAAVVEVARGARCTLALAALMVVWWCTEAVPLPVTALLPGLLLPMLHVTGIDQGKLYPFSAAVSFSRYASPVIFLFLAGFLLAGAMRKSGLDRRVTMAFLRWPMVTRNTATLLLSLMLITALLSMWISNTATAAMMLPIALGVLRELNEAPGQSPFGTAALLGVAWAASIGGLATVIGSPPNGIVVGILQEQGVADIDFVHWMIRGVPISAAALVLAWLLLMWRFRPRIAGMDAVRDVLHKQAATLQHWTADQRVTLGVFLLVVALWMTQPFWDHLLPAALARQLSRFGIHGIGMLGAVLLFVIPVQRRSWRAVLDWSDQHYVDWGTLLLFGGGIALSHAMLKTGLTAWLTQGFVNRVDALPALACLMLIVLLVDFLTEITSNTAVATMVTPVLILLAPQLGQDPVNLCIAAAMASSLAFMLPVATPPNALVYGTGYFRVADMMRAGVWMNLLGAGVVVCAFAWLAT